MKLSASQPSYSSPVGCSGESISLVEFSSLSTNDVGKGRTTQSRWTPAGCGQPCKSIHPLSHTETWGAWIYSVLMAPGITGHPEPPCLEQICRLAKPTKWSCRTQTAKLLSNVSLKAPTALIAQRQLLVRAVKMLHTAEKQHGSSRCNCNKYYCLNQCLLWASVFLIIFFSWGLTAFLHNHVSE